MSTSMEYSALRNDCATDMSSSSSDYDDDCMRRDDNFLGHVLVIWLIYGPIILVTIVGNFIVIMAFIREPAIRCRVANCFIFSLSIADFLVGLSMIFNFVWLLKDEWVLGQIPCMIWLSVDYALSFASVLAVILISLDRYRLVTLKLRYVTVQTRRRAVLTILCCWCFCLIFYPILVVAWSPVTGEYIIDYAYDCNVESKENLYVNLFLVTLEFFIPLMVLLYLNTRLYWTIRQRAKGLVQTSVPTVSSNVAPKSFKISRCDRASGVLYLDDSSPGTVSLTSMTIINGENDLGSGKVPAGAVGSSPLKDSTGSRQLMTIGDQRLSRSIIHRRREFHKHRKAAITLSVLVGVYILCWLPFYIKNTIVAFCGDCINYYILEVTDNLLWCNSTINPFLYALLNLQYRRYIAKVFRRLCCMFSKPLK